jgi:hypothetical protein
VIAADRTIPVGSAIRTLLYLDAHILLNRVKTVGRNPLRLILWLLFLGVIASSVQARISLNEAIKSRPLPGPSPLPLLLDPTPMLHVAATFVPALILVAYGLFTILACQQPLSAFRSAADARFLCGSALPPRLVVLWLSVRVILSLSWRIPLTLIFFVFVLPTSLGVSVSRGVGAFTAMLLLTTTLALNIPIFIGRQRNVRPNPTFVGWLLILLGLASLAVVTLAILPGTLSLPAWMREVAVSLPPGSWLVGAFEGNGAALIALAALAAGSVTLNWLVAGDVYPELWRASARMIVIRRAMRRRGPFMTPGDRRRLLSEAGITEKQRRSGQTAAASSTGRWVPTGAWTILWKEWLATRRVAGGLRVPAITLVLAVLLGAGIGALSNRVPGAGAFLFTPLIYVVVLGSFFTSLSMNRDLRKPIWWLSASSLRARLGVLLVARSLRLVVPIAAGLIAASVAGRSVTFFLVGLPITVAAIWVINSMGLATYAIIPGSSDMRGPGGCLRGVALIAMLIPIGIAAIAGAVATGSGLGSLVAAVLAALAEGWLLLLFAASVLDGNGLAFAQAERR